MRIDSHQHFWKYNPQRDDWITEEMKVLQKDFLPSGLRPLLETNHIDGCVLVQSEQSSEGNAFLLKQARENAFIKGIVGWVDLRADNLSEQLSRFKQIPEIKGFRHILQSEPNRALMLEPDFMKGIRLLGKFNYTYDILIFEDQLKYIPKFVRSFPDQIFILDHLAKPGIKEKKSSEWSKEIYRLSQFPNLYCKVSGMFTEADWKQWKLIDFVPYLEVVVESFGADRLIYGSDWPVCLLAVTYQQQFEVLLDYFAKLSDHEQEKIFGLNAMRAYGI